MTPATTRTATTLRNPPTRTDTELLPPQQTHLHGYLYIENAHAPSLSATTSTTAANGNTETLPLTNLLEFTQTLT